MRPFLPNVCGHVPLAPYVTTPACICPEPALTSPPLRDPAAKQVPFCTSSNPLHFLPCVASACLPALPPSQSRAQGCKHPPPGRIMSKEVHLQCRNCRAFPTLGMVWLGDMSCVSARMSACVSHGWPYAAFPKRRSTGPHEHTQTHTHARTPCTLRYTRRTLLPALTFSPALEGLKQSTSRQNYTAYTSGPYFVKMRWRVGDVSGDSWKQTPELACSRTV